MRNAVFLRENEHYFPIDLALAGKPAFCRSFTYFVAPLDGFGGLVVSMLACMSQLCGM
jgi:hypothetical protein